MHLSSIRMWMYQAASPCRMDQDVCANQIFVEIYIKMIVYAYGDSCYC